MKTVLMLVVTLFMVAMVSLPGYAMAKKAETCYDQMCLRAKDHDGVKEISYDQFMQIRKAEEPYTLLDVLSEESYQQGHIPGADSFPVADINAESAAARLDKKSNIVVYCASFKCQASVRAAKALTDLGYKVVDYKGGLKEWQEKGNDLES